jgi:hypothetical protein
MNKQQVVDIMQNLGSIEDVACCVQLLDFIEQKTRKIYYYADFPLRPFYTTQSDSAHGINP